MCSPTASADTDVRSRHRLYPLTRAHASRPWLTTPLVGRRLSASRSPTMPPTAAGRSSTAFSFPTASHSCNSYGFIKGNVVAL
eukprot:478934-Pleurochrysis_carterae.AAC.1